MGDKGLFYHEQHYEAALQNIDVMLAFGDSRSAAYLLLLALFCIKGRGDPGAWNLAGLAAILCVELGIHRKSTLSETLLKMQLDLRIF